MNMANKSIADGNSIDEADRLLLSGNIADMQNNQRLYSESYSETTVTDYDQSYKKELKRLKKENKRLNAENARLNIECGRLSKLVVSLTYPEES